MLSELVRDGWALLRAAGTDPMDGLVRSFARDGAFVTRDVIIGSDDADLRPHQGDFWFHTDGVFWSCPPRWVIIQVLEADGGGELQVLDTREFASEAPAATFLFGVRGPRRRAPLLCKCKGASAIRYRRDYMASGEPEDAQGQIDALVKRYASNALDVPSLRPQDCLVVHNWTLLHRRKMFIGERRIRRVWLDGTP